MSDILETMLAAVPDSSQKTVGFPIYRTKDWKFIEGSDGPKMIPWGPKIETGYLGIPQLYDMKQAGEKVNLATEHPEKVFELQQILRKVRDKSIQMK